MNLDDRPGWPAELRILLDRHPRSTWRTDRSASAKFWLEIHEHLRRDCAALDSLADDYRAESQAIARLGAIAGPRLRGLLAVLHGHHQIEDFQYFPALRRHEPRLAAGFDVLERDHQTLQHDVDAAFSALRELLLATEHSPIRDTSSRLAAGHYVDATERLCRRLRHHLRDEEDLVVPLLLERGDY